VPHGDANLVPTMRCTGKKDYHIAYKTAGYVRGRWCLHWLPNQNSASKIPSKPPTLKTEDLVEKRLQGKTKIVWENRMPSATLSTTNISRQLCGVCGICGVQSGTRTISLRVGLLWASPFIILPTVIVLVFHSFKTTLYNLETECVVKSVSSVRSLQYRSTSEAILISSNLVLLQLNISSVTFLQNISRTVVWVCVCMGFVKCRCFGNMCTCIYCAFVLFVLCFCIVSFMYIYSFYAFV